MVFPLGISTFHFFFLSYSFFLFFFRFFFHDKRRLSSVMKSAGSKILGETPPIRNRSRIISQVEGNLEAGSGGFVRNQSSKLKIYLRKISPSPSLILCRRKKNKKLECGTLGFDYRLIDFIYFFSVFPLPSPPYPLLLFPGKKIGGKKG